jgi:hypothetical protein
MSTSSPWGEAKVRYDAEPFEDIYRGTKGLICEHRHSHAHIGSPTMQYSQRVPDAWGQSGELQIVLALIIEEESVYRIKRLMLTVSTGMPLARARERRNNMGVPPPRKTGDHLIRHYLRSEVRSVTFTRLHPEFLLGGLFPTTRHADTFVAKACFFDDRTTTETSLRPHLWCCNFVVSFIFGAYFLDTIGQYCHRNTTLSFEVIRSVERTLPAKPDWKGFVDEELLTFRHSIAARAYLQRVYVLANIVPHSHELFVLNP